jgi:hypothetical protein
MRLRLKNLVIASSLLALAFAVSTTSAKADNLTVLLSGPGGTFTCPDTASCNTSGVPGVITFSTNFGTVTVSLGSIASGSPALNPLNLDLSYNITATSSNPGGTYVVQVGENNLAASGISFSGIANGNQDSGVTTAYSAFYSTGNVLFANGSSLCSAGPVGTTVVNLACSGGPVTATNFSLTEGVTLTVPEGTANASGDAKLTPMPDASGFSILAMGGLFFLGAIKRKFNS